MKNKIFPYINTGVPKCQQMQASSQWIRMYKGKQLKTSFSYMGYLCGLFEGPWGAFNDQNGSILLSSYPLTHIYLMK